jgi:hypothetical protein
LGSAADYQILAGSTLTIGAATSGTLSEIHDIPSYVFDDLSTAIHMVSVLPSVTTTADLGGLTYGPGP